MSTPLKPVSWRHVTIGPGFWRQRIDVNRERSLSYVYRQYQRTGRLDAWGHCPTDRPTAEPHQFWDSDVAKWLEAAAYSLGTHPNATLAEQVDALITGLERLQMADGYINSYYCRFPEKRWTDLRDGHELYNAGHLIEAAVAHHESCGSRKFLDIVCRFADHIDERFGPEEGKVRGYPGHPELELALVRLYHATGNPRYLALAKFFIEERGQELNYFILEHQDSPDQRCKDLTIYQAHQPLREQRTAEGHAVRAGYLYSGMVDVALATNDHELLAAAKVIWNNLITRRMYVHGGVGSTKYGERFTADHDLPNEHAYAETCAAISVIFLAHRLLQHQADAAYADVLERALYNCVLAGVSLDGEAFFYSNYLTSVPGHHHFTGQYPPERQTWFHCSCCPANVARLLASLGQYAYATNDDTLFVHLYIAGKVQAPVGSDGVTLNVESNYPWEGDITLSVTQTTGEPYTIALRLPGWCTDARVTVNGEAVNAKTNTRQGYCSLRRLWQVNDFIRLRLEMPVTTLECHPYVRANNGRVALQRGPLLFCLEETDNGEHLSAMRLPAASEMSSRWVPELLGGVTTISGTAERPLTENWEGQLYRPVQNTQLEKVPFEAIPYAHWANRGEGEMRVWMRR